MSNELRHEVTMVVNGESRRVMVEDQASAQTPAAEPVTEEATDQTGSDAVPSLDGDGTTPAPDESQAPGLMQTVKGILGIGS